MSEVNISMFNSWMQPQLIKSSQDNSVKKLRANSSPKLKACTQTGGRVRRNINKQPPSHKEGINTKNAKVPHNLDMRCQGGWNPKQFLGIWRWLVGTDDVKSGEHVLPCQPKKPRGMQGNKVTTLLWCTWTVYPLCNVMMRVTKRRDRWSQPKLSMRWKMLRHKPSGKKRTSTRRDYRFRYQTMGKKP